MTWLRDVILILVAVGLLVAVLWPAPKSDSATADASTFNGGSKVGTPERQEVPSPELIPLMNTAHRLFPMIEGGHWRYVVTGPKGLFSENEWGIRILQVPTKNTPGKIEMGFGKQLSEHEIWLKDEAVQISELPFSAPLRFLGNVPSSYDGQWLPPLKYVIDDAVWTYTRKRALSYRARGPNNNIIEEQSIGVQTDRAHVNRLEKVIVPAGVFDAYNILWTSRIDIRTKNKNRKVLQELTVEPFKKETMWFAPGIGLVRRRVTYESKNKEDIIFDLVSFTRPGNKK